MGSPNEGNEDEKPARKVTVDGFYMCRFPVTQREWLEVTGTTPCHFKGDNFPVVNVNWFDAIEYANLRSLREGLTPAYGTGDAGITWDRDANGYRLPTEAEWEFAARGGHDSPGNFMFSGSDNVDEVAWYCGNSVGNMHEVGTKKPNALGLYDMSGNVWEWVWDWYGRYPNMAQTNPDGAPPGAYRVIRGGSWGNSARDVRCASRNDYYYWNAPSDRYNTVGFRLVRALDSTGNHGQDLF